MINDECHVQRTGIQGDKDGNIITNGRTQLDVDFYLSKIGGGKLPTLMNCMGGIKVMDDWDSRINDELNMERELYKHLHECHVKKEGRK